MKNLSSVRHIDVIILLFFARGKPYYFNLPPALFIFIPSPLKILIFFFLPVYCLPHLVYHLFKPLYVFIVARCYYLLSYAIEIVFQFVLCKRNAYHDINPLYLKSIHASCVRLSPPLYIKYQNIS